MMIKSNCHTHTVFCDGKNTAEEMVKAAIVKGFFSLGFSVHSPMYFENDWAIAESRLDEYADCIHALKEKYADSIEIYNGIELDADHTDIDRADFDFVIGSVHQLHCADRIYSIDYTAEHLKDCVKNEFDGDWLSMAKQYYSSVGKFICTEKPQVVGHIDLIEKFNDGGKLFDSENVRYKEIAESCVEKICAECPDIIFEVNTGAMYRCGNSVPYPAKFILCRLRELNARITITSDAHCTESLDFAFENAVKHCKDCGFNEVYVLKGGGFVPIAI